ncbi:hypothetical protein CEXT_465801 [Caerostris extrusa]|uniref:Uncharacterized protein n=1 Tax=Caerostris extrusa TaxID=172846 RepID=A0AAV4PQZ3_CAEEX|nr:hypothetical protein CEXT_465801 [Caerostris extrusa]
MMDLVFSVSHPATRISKVPYSRPIQFLLGNEHGEEWLRHSGAKQINKTGKQSEASHQNVAKFSRKYVVNVMRGRYRKCRVVRSRKKLVSGSAFVKTHCGFLFACFVYFISLLLDSGSVRGMRRSLS